jgi:uncharacterized protein (UPF0333 family)
MGMICRKGQALLEYVLALAAMLVLVAVMGFFVSAARTSAIRAETLVSSDHP